MDDNKLYKCYKPNGHYVYNYGKPLDESAYVRIVEVPQENIIIKDSCCLFIKQ